MVPTDEDLAAVPEAIRDLYAEDAARWGAVVVAHARQRRDPAPVAVPVPPQRPPVREVLDLLRRQQGCPLARRHACACYCDLLDRRIFPPEDCRACDYLPAEAPGVLAD
jgi:hypothetical protein